MESIQAEQCRLANGLSRVFGATDDSLIEKTIPVVLADTVSRFGDREAAVFSEQNIRWSYAEFTSEVDTLAGGLLQSGFIKGDRIGVWSPNRAEWLLAQFATARLGVLLVNINPAYRLTELEYALNKVGCKGLITAAQFKTSSYVGMLQTLAPELGTAIPGELRSARLPQLSHIICMGGEVPPGMSAFDDICDAGKSVSKAQLDAISSELDRHDIINIQFTSGTTGLPKGASLTHRNIVNNAHFVTSTMAFTEHDRLCIPVPFYHCFGMVMGTLGCVTKGAAMIVPAEGFEPASTLKVAAEERCTALYGVPTMFVAMLESPDFSNHDLSRLRTGIMAGAPCPIEVMKNVQSKMNMHQITIAYGMTETSPVSFQGGVNDPLEKRVSSVGRIHPHVEVKIIDHEGHTVPVGQQGELLTRGYSVMHGYWDDAEQSRNSIDADGWMHTGDLATLDNDGYCKITGRLKDMICRGGENIYPREIEEYLYTHPAIGQVQVFGIPDVKYGEVVCAWVVAAAGKSVSEDEVRKYCEGQIAHYKVPAHVRLVDTLPMTVTGKPQKFIMRDTMIQDLNITTIETA
jgi:fatty-acyl-CoA synthase